MNPQSVTVGARFARRLQDLVILAAGKSPDPVAFCGGMLATLAGIVAGIIGRPSAAVILRISLAHLEDRPQLELPPGIREAVAAAESSLDPMEPSK